jgi:hypothetical protein
MGIDHAWKAEQKATGDTENGDTMTSVRPVWLTREQSDVLTWAANHLRSHAGARRYESRPEMKAYVIRMADQASEAVRQWDAAPADATEAAILGTLNPDYTENDRAFVAPIVMNVLRALGMPDPQPEPGVSA